MPLAIHPAMTFTGPTRTSTALADTCFGITAADEIGYAIAQSLVLEIGGEPFRVGGPTLYHAALAHGSNHVVTLIADALTGGIGRSGTARSGGRRRGRPAAWVEAVDPGPAGQGRAGELPRSAAGRLTGPVAARRPGAVAAHLDASMMDPQLAQAYCADRCEPRRLSTPGEVREVLAEWSRASALHR